MGHPSKRAREMAKGVDPAKAYTLSEAIAILKSAPAVKFNQTVDIALKLVVDPRKPEHNVRGVVSLPNGTGKTIRILVFAKGEKMKEALDAGADYAGHEELFEKVGGGWTEFDAVISTPDLMREVGKLGKVLGPRGLMPTPKAGTVTTDIAKAVAELKAGKIEFKVNKSADLHNGLGKLSFTEEQLLQNIKAYLDAVLRQKPASAKGGLIRSMVLSSTMGPGVKIRKSEFEIAIA